MSSNVHDALIDREIVHVASTPPKKRTAPEFSQYWLTTDAGVQASVLLDSSDA